MLLRVQTGGIPDHVRDVVLLVHAVEEVRHGPAGVDGHVLAPVGLVRVGNDGGLKELRVSFERGIAEAISFVRPQKLIRIGEV